jgi:hypothetical protein
MRIDKNYIVVNNNLSILDIDTLFEDEEIVMLTANKTIFDILADEGIFKSKSQARKNFVPRDICGNKIELDKFGNIPNGFTEFQVGKLNHRITTWNPIE